MPIASMRAAHLLIPVLALLTACTDPAARSSAQTPPLPQPTRRAPTDAGSMKLSFGPIVQRTAPAVVNISSKRVVRQQVDPFWEMFGGGVPRSRVEGSLGSGVIVRSDGVIVTNNHVVEGGQEITVALSDRREFPARLLLADPRTDLAVLKIEATGLPTLPIDTGEDLQVGDLVLAIGDPFGVGQTVTNGIISALNRTEIGQNASSYIQTDAAINPGNSGGALVDMDGDLIGVNSFILSGSGSSSGVGFAVPGAVVRQVVESAFGGAKSVARPWLGVRGQSVTGEIARSLGQDRPQGVLVAGVYPGSSAARAGVAEGDVVLAVDGQAVNDETGLNYRVSTHRPGDGVKLKVRRAGRELVLATRLEAPVATPAQDLKVIAGANPLAGATVINLSPAAAGDLGVDPFGQGVLITAIDPRGLAARASLNPGDFVRQINGKAIGTVSELQAALASGGRRWEVVIERDGRKIAAQFEL
jgi:Do/DeqQ family serine protease